MTILMAHNQYQNFGGEDQSYAAESGLLEANGCKVLRYTLHNRQIQGMNPLMLAQATLWNKQVYRNLREIMKREHPKIAHFQNTFPLISPAAYYAAKVEGVPVVQSLRNYRLLCPNALFFREGHICEECMGRTVPWPAVAHACYRNSRAASAVVTSMLTLHRAIGTWSRMVDVYIALTEFARNKFIEGGLPKEKIVVKPNFVYPDPGQGDGKGGYALFVGRLSPEKGVDTLLRAWELLGGRISLKIVGDGPLAEKVKKTASNIYGIEWLGHRNMEEVYSLMGEAAFLVFPSEWYETFGRVAIEAFAKGTPVLAAKIGAVGEITENGRTGLHFRAGDPIDLAEKVDWLMSHPAQLARMRKEARAEYEAKYTAERNYRMLMEIYERAISVARSGG